MPTRDDIYQAIRNADAAGDTASVQKLGAYLQTMAPAPAIAPATSTAAPTLTDKIASGIRAVTGPVNNALLGGLRGAADIGTTLLYPTDKLQDVIYGDRQMTPSELIKQQELGAGYKPPLSRNDQRKADIEDALTSLGADKGTVAYGSGRLGVQLAGTAGAGPVLGTVAKAAGAAAPVVNALASAGFTTGEAAAPGVAGFASNMLTRMAGGAAANGAGAALVDPASAGTAAEVGAVLPPSIKALGAAGGLAADAWRKMVASGDQAGARALAKALDAATPEQQAAVIATLRGAPTLVPNASPTVAQALGTPQAGILNRVVYDSPGGTVLRNKLAQQAGARTDALEAVAPTDVNGYASARADMGNAIARRAIPDEKAISNQISALYENIDPTGVARIRLPVGDMQGAVDRYLGPGSFGQGGKAQQAAQTARTLSPANVGSGVMNQPGLPEATWRETQRLRSSMGDAIQEAKTAGNNQEAAALTAQLKSLDDTVGRLAAGGGSNGEHFTPEMAAAWKDANAAHALKMQRFHTGPQAAIFQKGADGQPLVQGGEVAAKFWGQGPGAAENVQSFRRLVDDNPALLGQFKSMVTTQGAGTADAAGNLTTKFSKWVKQSLPGLREAFTPEELDTMQRIAADIDRNAASVKAGTSLGGSNTYQNASNALDLGVLDSPLLSKAANMVPGLRYATGPALEGVRGFARNAKANKLAALLADSGTAANALERLNQPQLSDAEINRLSALLGVSASRTVPVAASR